MDEKTGELLLTATLAERVGRCVDLVSGMADSLLAAHWNAIDVDVLASGEDAMGRKLPSNAWMALRRLGWTVGPAEGIRVNDRIVRTAQETAGRTARSAKWRADLTAAVVATWPADPSKRTTAEWEAVRAAAPGGEYLPSSVIKGRTRQVAVFVREHGRLPVDVFEAEAAPRPARMLLLSACDGQQATIERHDDDPGRILLRLQLPTQSDPRSYKDWTWVSCPISLPPTIPASAVLHLPNLRIRRGRVRADLAYTHAVPKTARTGHTVALGVDWGLTTLLSAGAARLHEDGTITALGARGMFRAAGVLAKQHRLRRLGERLDAKADRYERLTGEAEQHPLNRKQAVLADEIQAVSDRRSNLNDALAWAGARWAVDQAVTAGASVIYLEDLRSMEARGMGRTMNTRLSQVVRGQITDRVRHLAAEAGIAVVTVPARNTSKHCPQCLTPLRHRKAPDRPTVPGWKWALWPRLQVARRPRYRGVETHRRTRPHPPGQDRDDPRQRHHGDSLRDRCARSRGSHLTDCRQDQPEGPVQDRTHPATHLTPRAQATQGTLPHQTPRSGGQASGGTRSHGPEAAAPRSQPAPGRDDDRPTHHRSPTTRNSTGRRLPPARPRHPSTVGNSPAGQ
ncbi:transposase [Streptomyces sp. NBC_01351]|uniref:transposase n=1 Tax=Streptomyces sp. NBC_01351 TaxID=2903833 RepID=UPI002E34764C|nr:transposase [Streptomyces sp. NBC_01351]